MSYSFNVRAANKVLALALVAGELDKVVAAQSNHSADRAQAQGAAEAFVGVIGEPSEEQEVYVSVSGSLSWTESATTSASVTVHASLVAKQKQE